MSAPPRGRRVRALRREPLATNCSAEGCASNAVELCAYTDDAGGRCDTAWCEKHISHVAGLPVCRRHHDTLEILKSREDSIYEVGRRPPVADRSLSLTVHLAHVLGPTVEALLKDTQGAWPNAHVEPEQHPRPFWNSEGALSGWELGWSVISPRGRHLRVAIRARSGVASPSVQVVAEHMIAYDDEVPAETVRGQRTQAQLEFMEEIQRMVSETLRSASGEWLPI